MGQPTKINQPKIDLNSLETMECEACGGRLWSELSYMKIVPALLSNTGKPGLVPIPVVACANCLHVNETFNPIKVITVEHEMPAPQSSLLVK